jgi:hypothetical protein
MAKKNYVLSKEEEAVLVTLRKITFVKNSDSENYNPKLITKDTLKRAGIRKKQIRTIQHAHWHQANLNSDDKAIIERTKSLLPNLQASKSKKQGGKNKRRIQKASKHHPDTADIGNNEYPRKSSDELKTLGNESVQHTDNVVELPTVTDDNIEEKVAVNQ